MLSDFEKIVQLREIWQELIKHDSATSLVHFHTKCFNFNNTIRAASFQQIGELQRTLNFIEINIVSEQIIQQLQSSSSSSSSNTHIFLDTIEGLSLYCAEFKKRLIELDYFKVYNESLLKLPSLERQSKILLKILNEKKISELVILDNIQAVIVDCTDCKKSFQETQGIEVICSLLRYKGTSEAVRMKCIETLCIYLSLERNATLEDQNDRKQKIRSYLNEKFVAKLIQMVYKQQKEEVEKQNNATMAAQPLTNDVYKPNKFSDMPLPSSSAFQKETNGKKYKQPSETNTFDQNRGGMAMSQNSQSNISNHNTTTNNANNHNTKNHPIMTIPPNAISPWMLKTPLSVDQPQRVSSKLIYNEKDDKNSKMINGGKFGQQETPTPYGSRPSLLKYIDNNSKTLTPTNFHNIANNNFMTMNQYNDHIVNENDHNTFQNNSNDKLDTSNRLQFTILDQKSTQKKRFPTVLYSDKK